MSRKSAPVRSLAFTTPATSTKTPSTFAPPASPFPKQPSFSTEVSRSRSALARGPAAQAWSAGISSWRRRQVLRTLLPIHQGYGVRSGHAKAAPPSDDEAGSAGSRAERKDKGKRKNCSARRGHASGSTSRSLSSTKHGVRLGLVRQSLARTGRFLKTIAFVGLLKRRNFKDDSLSWAS